ncbi:hypothetical protein N7U49_21260 [Streptomyces sp. AD2-2]|nr:hypothetical protein N7U49_21260 [Streptomyces sp. AD2-2]
MPPSRPSPCSSSRASTAVPAAAGSSGAPASGGEALLQEWAAEGYDTFWTEIGETGLSKPFELVDGERVEIK